MALYTAEEVRQRYVETMGADLGDVFHRLVNQCALLHVKWNEYVVLFGTSEARTNLLNRAAPSYFHMLQEVLFEDVMLHICRITDRATVSGRETLTVTRLTKAGRKVAGLDALLDDVHTKTAFARDWRNRHIGHQDLELALNTATPLKPATRQGVRDAIAAIAAALNCVERHYGGSPVAFELVMPAPGDAEALLGVLTAGVDALAERYGRP